MVKNLILIVSFLATLSLSGCSFVNRIWGEAPPPRKTVVIEGEALPEFSRIFGEDEKDALFCLSAWQKNILSSFNAIEGSKKDFLTRDEISTLVREGFVNLSPNKTLSVKRAQAIVTLLGFKDGISLVDVRALLSWLEIHREETKTFYQMFIAENPKNDAWTSKDLLEVLSLFGSLIELGGSEALQAKTMADLIDPWIPETFPHAKAGLESAFDLGISFFASFCGDRVDAHDWNGKKIGTCIREAAEHFSPTTAAFDFLFGRLNPFERAEELKTANSILASKVETWLKGHAHPAFPTGRVAAFATSMSIPPPYQFFKLTEWLPKLNPESTEKAFSPTFFIDLSKVLSRYVETFQTTIVSERCAPTQHPDWKSCAFRGVYDSADRIYNEEYAALIREKNIGFINQITFYDSLAKFLFDKLDTDGDGYLGDNIKDLVGIAIRLLDSNAFAYNVVQRIQEKPIDLSSAEESMKSIKRQGLAELAAYASDLIPERAKNKRSFLKKLQAQIYSPEKGVAYTLDPLGVTTFLYIYDLISTLRYDYIDHYDLPTVKEGSLTFVKRRAIVKALPSILYDHFPRIYENCIKWGFERTCGVVFTEVLPSSSPGRDDLETFEMDVITLTGILLESMMSRCDRNNDGVFSANLFDGFDEKHCVINVSQALARRLMNANIVEKDSTAELMMTLVKKVPFVRWIGKVAIARGTMKGIVWRAIPPISLISGSATLGSVLSLAAEFMDSDKVDAINEQREGPVEDTGDEMIYLNRLSTAYLPRIERPLRGMVAYE